MASSPWRSTSARRSRRRGRPPRSRGRVIAPRVRTPRTVRRSSPSRSRTAPWACTPRRATPSTRTRASPCAASAGWSPPLSRGIELPILAVGYADGRLRYWSCRDRRATEDADVHYGRTITVAAWTPTARASSPATPRAASACGRSTNDTAQRPCADTTGSPPAPRGHPRRRPTARRRRGDGASAEDADVERTAKSATADGRTGGADADGSPSHTAPARRFHHPSSPTAGRAVLRADDRGGSARLIEADAEFTWCFTATAPVSW